MVWLMMFTSPKVNGSTGWTFRPTNVLSRVRTFVSVDRQVDTSGQVINRAVQPGIGMDTKASGFVQFQYGDGAIRTAAGDLIGRRQFLYYAQFSPSRTFAQIESDGALGTDIDFDNSRPAQGQTINFSAILRPTVHLELAFIENQQTLHVNDAAGSSRRRAGRAWCRPFWNRR